MSNDIYNTKVYSAEQIKQENIKYIVKTVYNALTERGYDPNVQLVGYLTTNDPAYISSYKGARTLIQTVERDEILKELVRAYMVNAEDK